MAFSSLSDTLIQVGKAVKREIFTTLKDNQDDLNTRVGTVEAAGAKIEVFNGIVLNASSAGSLTGFLFYRSPSTFRLNDAKVGIFDISGKSFSGTLEFDIQKSSSPDFTSSTSVFTTRPSLDFSTANSYDESTNVVFDAGNQSVNEGDYIRLDVTSLPSGDTLSKFQVYLYGEAS